jgi:hypothetical protein
LSALWVSHSHHDSSAELELDGGALVVDDETEFIAFKDVNGSSMPDADATRLDNEPNEVVARRFEVSTGSDGTSFGGVSGSVCKPTGFRGRRRVPLLGAGSAPMESQMMLYSSIFSELKVNGELKNKR